MFFSEQGQLQELLALGLVGLSVLYMVHRFTGWPRPRAVAPPEETPDAVLLGKGLSRGLKKAEREKRRRG